MPRCNQDLWPLDLKILQQFGCHAFKLCIKFERNRISAFSRAILRGGSELTELSQGCVIMRRPNFTKLGQDIGRSSQHIWHFCFRIRISCCILHGGSKVTEASNDAKFCILTPPPVKNRGGWARCLYQLLKLYVRPNPQNTSILMVIHCAAAEHGIDKKEEKVHGENLRPSRLMRTT